MTLSQASGRGLRCKIAYVYIYAFLIHIYMCIDFRMYVYINIYDLAHQVDRSG